MKKTRDNTRQGNNTTHHPRHSTGPPRKQKGDTTHKTGTPAFDGESITLPPFPHHATHHPLCHPPSTTAPPTTTVRGERTEDTPPHKQHTETHTTHTPQRLATDSARHDSSTRQRRSGMSGARVTPPHWTGQ